MPTANRIRRSLKLRNDVLHAIEEGNNPTAELADYVATRNVECILDTMERLGIRYDLLARESEILHLHFWDRAFRVDERTRRDSACETEGRNTRAAGSCRLNRTPAPTNTNQTRSSCVRMAPYLHRQRHRLSAVEAGPAGSRFQLQTFSLLSRRPRDLGHDHRAER